MAWTWPNVWTTLGILVHVCAYDEWMNEWMGMACFIEVPALSETQKVLELASKGSL